MSVGLAILNNAELAVGGFLFPWAMLVGCVGFLLALYVTGIFERLGWTRAVWHLPLFFLALAVFLACAFGLVVAP
jgi:hypothetical protein